MRIAIATIAAIAAFAVPYTAFAHSPNPHKLPLGDGKHSSGPKVGYIWACHTDPNGGGAQVDGPWINKSAGTFDITKKAIVDGSVTWPHSFKMTVSGNKRVITWDDLPDYPTGKFPISRSDDAYKYDRNPNSIKKQSMKVSLPLTPQLAAKASCTPGAIGVLLTGVVLFNALDAPGRDAVAHETQDACEGHPQESGVYHNHNVSNCALKELDSKSGPSKLVGYAVDGFGIYGPRDENGNTLSTADLDACHGRTSPVMWNGKMVTMYHYVATLDFPYDIGCLRGSWSESTVRALSGPRVSHNRPSGGGRNPPARRGPPPPRG